MNGGLLSFAELGLILLGSHSYLLCSYERLKASGISRGLMRVFLDTYNYNGLGGILDALSDSFLSAFSCLKRI